MDDNQIQISDFNSIIRRRYKGFILLTILFSILGLVVAFILPPIYRSQTTILVEGQQIPSEYVQTTVSAFIDERLKVITQRVLSRPKLIDIIDQFGLYKDLKKKYSTEEIIKKMRNDISIDTISANVMKRGSGGGSNATIAFTIAYEGKSPGQVQQVANVLATQYLEENVKTREKQAATTTDFLNDEQKNLKDEISSLEESISEFKQAHVGELPEYSSINLQTLERLQRDMDQIDIQLRSLEERKTYLEGQLAVTNPNITSAGGSQANATDPAERLRQLRMQALSLSARLSEKHPDMIQLNNEIAELEAQVQGVGATQGRLDRVRQAESELSQLKSKYGAKHPDVIRKQREVNALYKDIRDSRRVTASSGGGPVHASNPAYSNLKTQIASTDLALSTLKEEKRKITLKLDEYQKRIEHTPLVEREYNALIRDYELARHRYNELTNKLLEARAAQSMEETQLAGRFTIIDPAMYPSKPYKPNRYAIILIGIVLGFGAGAAYAAGREALDNTIKTPRDLAKITQLPMLTVVPYVENAHEKRKKRFRWIILGLAVVVLLVAALVTLHFMFGPLDILWIKIQKRFLLS